MIKINIFQCMGQIFCLKFQIITLKFHTKYLTHTLYIILFVILLIHSYTSTVANVEVWKRISNIISHFTKHVVTYPCWDYMSIKETPLTGVGVTKAALVNFSIINIFDLTKVPLKWYESYSYLINATAAELQWHLSNMNVIFNNYRAFRKCWKS